jgi:hypothetical protein
MEVKHAYVSGLSLYNASPPGKRFGGRIRFEKRAGGVYYTGGLKTRTATFSAKLVDPSRSVWYRRGTIFSTTLLVTLSKASANTG